MGEGFGRPSAMQVMQPPTEMRHAPSEAARDASPGPFDAATRDALVHLAVVVAVLGALAGATYLSPSLERYRPWVPGEPPPLASLWKAWKEPPALPSFAGGSPGGYRGVQDDGEVLAERLGTAVAANLGAQDDEAGDLSSSLGGSAVESRAVEGAGSGPASPGIDPAEYADIEVSIEDPGDRGMRPFYEALLRTARKEQGALTRVAHYGDSSIATDLITYTVRRRLQRRFGDGGHGFLLVAKGYMPWRHRDVRHASGGGWKLYEIVRGRLGVGAYGYGGVGYRGSPGAWARFGTADEQSPVGRRVSRFELFYQRGPRGGTVRLRVDDGENVYLDTRGDRQSDEVWRVQLPDGPHQLDLRVTSGRPFLYGVVLEREGPGVVYDSLGLVGARARRLLFFDPEHIHRQMELRRPNLIVLGFGGNEASDRIGGEGRRYEDDFLKVIERMRAGRQGVGCLVVAPLDQARRDERGRIRTMPTIPVIVAAQRRAAKRAGCAFYDTFSAMGGEGAMRRWYRVRPRLAMGDFRHATPKGYEVIGNLLYKAMLKGFDKWLRTRR